MNHDEILPQIVYVSQDKRFKSLYFLFNIGRINQKQALDENLLPYTSCVSILLIFVFLSIFLLLSLSMCNIRKYCITVKQKTEKCPF
jgi:hypothetical protein